jgi:hypothetical protein
MNIMYVCISISLLHRILLVASGLKVDNCGYIIHLMAYMACGIRYHVWDRVG